MAEIRGLAELLDNLDGLNVTVRTAGRGATNAAAQVVKKQAIVNARAQGLVDTGALVDNIAVKRQTGTSPTWFEYHIGVRHGKEAKGAQRIAVRGSDGKVRFEYSDNPFYWFFWEFGHYNTWAKRFIAARPFLRPAMLSKEGELVEVMRTYLAAKIEKITMKAAAK